MGRIKPILLILLWQFMPSNGHKPDSGCLYQRTTYYYGDTIVKDDCREYICHDHYWTETNKTNPSCCYYGYSEEVEYGDSHNNPDGSYYGYHGLFGKIPLKGCTDLVCVASQTWETQVVSSSDCQSCEVNGTWYRANSTFYKKDCHEYLCLNGILETTGNSDPNCCRYYGYDDYDYYYPMDYYYDYPSEIEYRNSKEPIFGNNLHNKLSNSFGYYPLNATITRSNNCSDATCVGRNTWKSDDCQICEYEGMSYGHNSLVYKNDCLKYICENGDWNPTGVSDRYCCNMYEYLFEQWAEGEFHYGNSYSYFKYHEFNSTIPMANCSELVCVGWDTWQRRSLDPSDCITCEYHGLLYRTNDTVFRDDCYGYLCHDGILEMMNNTDPECCHDSYTTYGLHETLSNEDCANATCIARETWDVEDCQMCEYKTTFYMNGYEVLQDDCERYRCDNGVWNSTNNPYERCCYMNSYILRETWGSDASYYASGGYVAGSHHFNGTIPLPNCRELVCVSLSSWALRELEGTDCETCHHGAYLYRDEETRNDADDCHEYMCHHGIWEKTNNTNEECCYYSYDDWRYDWYNWIGSDAYAYPYYTYHALGESRPRYNCSNITCVAKNVWDSEDCKRCEYDGTWYSHERRLFRDDCIEYICENGDFLSTNNTDHQCCYYYRIQNYEDYWNDYRGYYDLNETVPGLHCSEYVCLRRNVWEEREINLSECCKFHGHYHNPNEIWYEDDCYEYICDNGNMRKTDSNVTDPKCCWYDDWHDDWYSYVGSIAYNNYYHGDYELHTTIPRYNCSNITCVARNVWESDDCKRCKYKDDWYTYNEIDIQDDCIEYICNNGEWTPTNNTDDRCCYKSSYYDGYYLSGSSGYYGLNETVIHKDCSHIVCVERNVWEVIKLNYSDCCEFEGRWYVPNQRWFEDNCYEYVCQGTVTSRTNNTDPRCCYRHHYIFYDDDDDNYYDYYNPEEFQMHNRHSRQHYRWWHYDENDFDVEYSDYRSEWYDSYYTLNASSYSENCQEYVCVDKHTWEATNDTFSSCCAYNGKWHHHGLPLYHEDCLGYVCQYGSWVKTNYSDPACCKNPDWIFEEEQYEYEYWWSDYDFGSPYYGDGEATNKWHRIDSIRTRFDCEQFQCIGRDTWLPLGSDLSNCSPDVFNCEFNGKSYNHSERLPGCMKVYCIDGNWLQKGYFDPQCDSCYARWDPHLRTLDGYYYDFHGICEYSMTQNGTSYDPNFGIFSEFYNCWQAACVGPSTYKDNPNTTIKMGVDGRYAPHLYTLYVNEVAYVIPDSIPRPVMEGNTSHPVLAWQYGSCIRLLGSSKLAVQKCGSSLEIWASSDFFDTLYGLCGYYDGLSTNDFTRRDLTQAPLEQFPSGPEFPDTWEVTGGCHDNAMPGRRRRDTEEDDCNVNSTTKAEITLLCNETISNAGMNFTSEDFKAMLDDCIFDLCTISKNTSGDPEFMIQWINEIALSVDEIADVVEKTTVADVVPEPLPREQPPQVTVVDPPNETTTPETILETTLTFEPILETTLTPETILETTLTFEPILETTSETTSDCGCNSCNEFKNFIKITVY